MNNKQITVVIILVLILIGIFVGVFFAVFEKRDSERDVGLQGEAAFNPLLLAQRFLENSGIEAESVVSMLKLEKMPARHDILFLATQRFDLSSEKREEILQWVESGGHLIIVAWPQADSDSKLQDPILEQLHINVIQDTALLDILDDECDANTELKETSDQENANADEQITNSEDCKAADYPTVAVTIVKEREKSKVAFDQSIWLTTTNENKANWFVAGDNGAQLIEYKIEKGLITVLSDYHFLTNEQLDKNDHAAFLWYLVHYSNSSGKVWIVFKGDMPPLYEWLIENLWAAFVTLIFIIFMWIWSVLPRFGALYPTHSFNRRNLIEHIRASGNFLWNNKFSDSLILDTRNALHAQISLRHPNWQNLIKKELYSKLAKQTGLNTTDIEFALTTQSTKKEHEFILIIQTLERLRKLI